MQLAANTARRTRMRAKARLAGLGTMIGAAATILFAAALCPLTLALVGISAVLDPEFIHTPIPLDGMSRELLSLIGGASAAGATAGMLAGFLGAKRADGRALVVCLSAALVGMLTSMLLRGHGPTSPARWIGATLLALALGALLYALWNPLVRSIRGSPGVARAVWAGAGRLAALGVALLSGLLAPPYTVVLLGVLVRTVAGDPPAEAWRAGVFGLAGTALTFGTAFLGLYLAGVPRSWSALHHSMNLPAADKPDPDGTR